MFLHVRSVRQYLNHDFLYNPEQICNGNNPPGEYGYYLLLYPGYQGLTDGC